MLWDDLLWGIVFMTVGGYFIYNNMDLIKDYIDNNENFIATTGQIKEYDYNDSDLKAIIVQYTVDRKVYTMKSSVYSKMPAAIGTSVDIKYNEDNPKEAIFANDYTTLAIPIAAALSILVGFVIFISDIGKIIKRVPIPVEPGPVVPAAPTEPVAEVKSEEEQACSE